MDGPTHYVLFFDSASPSFCESMSGCSSCFSISPMIHLITILFGRERGKEGREGRRRERRRRGEGEVGRRGEGKVGRRGEREVGRGKGEGKVGRRGEGEVGRGKGEGQEEGKPNREKLFIGCSTQKVSNRLCDPRATS